MRWLIALAACLVLGGCSEHQETVDCGPKGVKEVTPSRTVICNGGKVFQL